jgi:urease accessory protein
MIGHFLRAANARFLLVLPFALSSAAAHAHPGHGQSGFAAGLVHPLAGVDHMLAMVMAGLWAGLCFGRRWPVCAFAFLAAMLAGFAWGASGGAFPIAEALILASLFGLGGALLLGLRAPMIAASSVVALFATAHGFAHGGEMAEGSAAAFAAGFLLSTLALIAAGAALAQMRAPRSLARAVGAVAIAAGAMISAGA